MTRRKEEDQLVPQRPFVKFTRGTPVAAKPKRQDVDRFLILHSGVPLLKKIASNQDVQRNDD